MKIEGGLRKREMEDADDEDADLMKAIALSLNGEDPGGGAGTSAQAQAPDQAGPSSSSYLPLGALGATKAHSGGNSSTAAALDQDEVDHMMTGPFDEGEAVSLQAGGGAQFEDDEDADLARAIAASLADQGADVAGPSSSSAPQAADDEELGDEPQPGPDVISLAFNLPTIGRVQRLFLITRDNPSSVYKFLRTTLKANGEMRPGLPMTISRSYPRQELNEGDARTLIEIGISQSEVLNVLRK